MANAQVEKIKALGMRHGEKAAVAIAAAVFLLLWGLAFAKKSIDKTPEQVLASATQAKANLNRNEPREAILKTLEDQWLKHPDYVKLVEEQEKNSLNPDVFKASRPWVSLEPGAGLIRDMPEIIAVTDLNAFPGRGGFLVFELDESGKRILEDPEKAKKPDKASQTRRVKRRRRGQRAGGPGGMMGGGGYGGMMGGAGMGGAAGEETPEQKKAREVRDRQRKASVAGKAKADSAKAKGTEGEKPEDENGPEGPFKEVDKGYRWVSITGTLDHKKMKENWAAALKFPTAAPNYLQLDVQRQSLQSDGTWSDFEDVDAAKNRAIVFNLPEEEEELTPEDVRINALVDPLPFLKAGYWQGVHVASLVPAEKLETTAPATGGGMMGPGGMMGGGGMAGMTGPGGAGKSGGYPGMGGGGGYPGMGGGGGYPGMGGGGGYPGMGRGGAVGGGDENQDFQKSEAETVMVRSLDFTAEPDTTYRFKVRVVVINPNYNHEDVSPGVDTKSFELKGPWSEPTQPVSMPPDVAAYAMAKTPSGAGSRRSDQVRFEVARWNPSDGVTVVRTFDAGPGEIIGEPASTPIPTSDGSKMTNKTVDYNSRQIVLDTAGGRQAISGVGASGAPLDVPALSLMLRPDGSVMVRNQAFDLSDPVRKDIEENYKREVKESGKARENSTGMMGGGMMGGGGGYPGMGGGGGYPGMGRGGMGSGRR